MPDSTAPIATVLRIVGKRHELRKARGFSLGELEQAGLKRPQVLSMGIRTDRRRATVHAHNVEALKTFLNSSPLKASAPQPVTQPSIEAPEPEQPPQAAEKEAKPSRKTRAKPKKKPA